MSVNVVDKSTGNLTKIAGNPIEQASGISYDHTSSGMAANNVQAAVDELKSGLTNKLDNQRNNVIARNYAEAFTDYIFGNETDFYGYMPIIRKKQADGTYISFGIYEDKFVKVTYDAQGQFVRSQVATFS